MLHQHLKLGKLSLYLNDRASDSVIITLNKYAQAIRRMPNFAQYMSNTMKDDFNRYGLVKSYDGIGIAGISGSKENWYRFSSSSRQTYLWCGRKTGKS